MPLILGTNSIKDTGYNVDNSVRLESGDSSYLDKTYSSASDSNKKLTVSAWIKKSKDGATDSHQDVFSAFRSSDGFQTDIIRFQSTDQLQFFSFTNLGGSSGTTTLKTNRLFRDISAWYHIVVRVDTTQSTASDRVRIYVNGIQETSFATESYPSQNSELVPFGIGSGVSHQIGAVGNSNHFSGYLAEVVYLDNQSLDATSFGEFDSDSPTVWKPKDVSGLTFGTNGFYLEFKVAGNIGLDTSGNSNNFDGNNLQQLDQSTDTCTNNFATFNSLDNTNSQFTFSQGNLRGSYSGSNGSGTGSTATFGLSQGKWYWELTYDSSNDTPLRVGITDRVAVATSTTNRVGFGDNDFAYDQFDGKIYTDNDTGSSYGATYAVGDIIGVALDLDNNKIYFSKNGTFQNSGNPAGNSNGFSITASSSIANGFYFPVVSLISGSGVAQVSYNFGSPPYTVSSGNADSEGFGNFEYAVPSGYFALCTKNLAEYG